MDGEIRFVRDERDRRIGRLTLSHPGKLNAISVSMWGALRTLAEGFDAVGAPPLAAIVIAGEGDNFAAGADIEEFPAFRFDERTLRAYHEGVIAPALQALLATEVPLVAQIDGACVGGGLEIACCCDIRIAARTARFGAPIAKLGFPMAPDELAVVLAAAGRDSAAELLLEAGLIDAATALQRGLVHRLADDPAAEAWASAQRIAALPLEVARANKRTLRQLRPSPSTANARRGHFDYADAEFHREGIRAFLERRAPRFDDTDA
ncbi:enoyl-CoA hydratase/isomerase family protein [Rivibacter subsaxonicus]|uniref:Enoyl-CoA hydratase/carnithine racemase n=1 Tax=Rivibacter subsaxonicus TaxID=457575 RepID=A0A4Q7VGY6_9BURK|nr:enoyl-CoA hydratase-related protein [Rivibacter subsaxonicus]RZT95320.1 enoyl-CoA hydratase/carnithine racemase [Rivibacter subsaxonicus]